MTHTYWDILLQKQLKECGVFGVSSAECLDYALQNRQEWQEKGEAIVREFQQKYCETTAMETEEDDEEVIFA